MVLQDTGVVAFVHGLDHLVEVFTSVVPGERVKGYDLDDDLFAIPW